MPKGIYKRTAEMKTGKHMQGRKLSEETKRRVSESLIGNKRSLGYKHTEDHIRKNREAHSGEKSSSWRGDEVEYSGIHRRIIKRLGSPRYCEHCKRTDRKRYEWSNKDHKYSLKIEDWQRLCISCHKKYDITFNKKS